MLSHHELATLMLLRDTGRHMEEFDPDVLALRHYELVEVRTQDRDGSTLQLQAAASCCSACIWTAAACNRDASAPHRTSAIPRSAGLPVRWPPMGRCGTNPAFLLMTNTLRCNELKNTQGLK
jgi:hypothetical protein